MPLFSYRCTECDHEFEYLLLGADTPACPSCGGQVLDKLLSRVAPEPRVPEPVGACATCGQYGDCQAAQA